MKPIVHLSLLCLLVCCVLGTFFDPNQHEIDASFVELQRDIAVPRDIDGEACAAAQMNFYWNHNGEVHHISPRFAQLYFFPNGTFTDISYNYDGEWTLFGERGDNILAFNYPSARYVSPDNDGSGSMISHQVCGYWTFQSFKWYCESVCS